MWGMTRIDESRGRNVLIFGGVCHSGHFPARWQTHLPMNLSVGLLCLKAVSASKAGGSFLSQNWYVHPVTAACTIAFAASAWVWRAPSSEIGWRKRCQAGSLMAGPRGSLPSSLRVISWWSRAPGTPINRTGAWRGELKCRSGSAPGFQMQERLARVPQALDSRSLSSAGRSCCARSHTEL